MSQYPNPPQPQPQWQGQWQPPPPPPGPPPGPRAGVWIAVTGCVLVLVLGVFGVTAFAAPGFLVDDDSDDSSRESSSESDEGEEDDGPPGQAIEVPPPNASTPESAPDEPDLPEGAAPAGDPAGFAQEYLARVAAGDAAGVDEAMCADDQEWQYEDAVSEGRVLGLSEPRADDTAPGGLLADLTGPEGSVDGRITVLPDDDGGGWCIDVFYVF
jgi:hypothetical protein